MAQLVEYASDSGVHCMAVSPDNKDLYSADDTGNAIWTHAVQPNGSLKYIGKHILFSAYHKHITDSLLHFIFIKYTILFP